MTTTNIDVKMILSEIEYHLEYDMFKEAISKLKDIKEYLDKDTYTMILNSIVQTYKCWYIKNHRNNY